MERDTWLEERRKTIGSSDAAVLWNCGYAGSSWYALWAEKVHGIPPTFDKATERSLRRGQIMEPFVREEAARELGVELLYSEGYNSFTCEAHPLLSATLDAWHIDSGTTIIPDELKYLGEHMRREWGDDLLPWKYEAQARHQMLVVNAPYANVIAMIGDDVLIRRVDRDEVWDSQHLDLCQEFWWHVQNGVAPEVDAAIGTTEAIKKQWPRERGPRVDGTEEIDQLTEEIERWESEQKVLADCIEKRKNRLRELIGDAEGVISPSGVEWTWKVQKRAGYVVEPGESRVLRRVGKRKAKA